MSFILGSTLLGLILILAGLVLLMPLTILEIVGVITVSTGGILITFGEFKNGQR